MHRMEITIMRMNVWPQILMYTCLQIFAYIVTSWPDQSFFYFLCYTSWKNIYVCTHEGVLFVCYCVETKTSIFKYMAEVSIEMALKCILYTIKACQPIIL